MNRDILSPEPLFRNIVLSVIPSWHCDAHCLHCFIPASKRKRDSRSSSHLLSESLSKLPEDIGALAFTGGEPFLHPERLRKLIHLCYKQHRFSTVVTNGLWFRKSRDPRKLLKRLHCDGLRGISISIDAYHRPLLDDEEVIELLRTARSLGMAVNIRGAGSEAKRRGRRIAKANILDGQENTTRFFSLENVGHASRLPTDKKSERRTLNFCMAAMQPLVMPDGRVLACCSAHMFLIKNKVLDLGHLAKEPLEDILNRACRSYLLAALAATGPLGLAGILGRKVVIGDKTRCELCLEILNNPEDVAELERRISDSLKLRKEITGRMMIWEQCYRPDLLPQFQSGV